MKSIERKMDVERERERERESEINRKRDGWRDRERMRGVWMDDVWVEAKRGREREGGSACV